MFCTPIPRPFPTYHSSVRSSTEETKYLFFTAIISLRSSQVRVACSQEHPWVSFFLIQINRFWMSPNIFQLFVIFYHCLCSFLPFLFSSFCHYLFWIWVNVYIYILYIILVFLLFTLICMYLYNVYKVMNFLTLSAALVFIKLIFLKIIQL